MSWNFNPGNFIKQLAASVSIFTFCMSPVAQGAQSAAHRKELINRYLKETGLTTKKMTVRQYWQLVRHVYPEPLKSRMESWVRNYGDQMMPTITATTIKSREGEEQVRLTLSREGETVNLTFTGDEDVPLKVNAVAVTKKELLDFKHTDKLANKLVKNDQSIRKAYPKFKVANVARSPFLTVEQFKKLKPRQRGMYLIELRQVLDAAAKVYPAFYGDQASLEMNRIEFVRRLIMGEFADAKKSSGLTGRACILAGYITKYGENGSCGGQRTGAENFSQAYAGDVQSCGSGEKPCNPLVYGYSSNGSVHCVTSEARDGFKHATQNCNKAAPIDTEQQREAIVDSYVKMKNTQDASYLSDLEDYIHLVQQQCSEGQISVAIKKHGRKDQKEACDALKDRIIKLERALNVLDPVDVVASRDGDCDKKMPNSVPDGKGGCQCPDGYKSDGSACSLVMTGDGEELTGSGGAPAVEEPSFWDKYKNWIIGIGVFGAAAGILWLIFKDGGKAKAAPQYIAPAPVPEPTPTNPTDPVVSPVPTPIDPVVVEPPLSTSEGGATTAPTGTAGGVR